MAILVQGNIDLTQPLYSLVIGQTGIIYNERHDGMTDGRLKVIFKTVNQMAPLSYFVIYYIHISGEIIYDMLPLTFKTKLTNHVSIFNSKLFFELIQSILFNSWT
jgi:hypothetical protein